MKPLYKKFSRSEFDADGKLERFTIQCPDNFNFAYDVVDEIAAKEPDKTALVWCDTENREKVITFGEMSRLSNRAANFLTRNGIKKGSRVMLILKRHFEYWYTILALHKIGAIAVPATYMLSCEDIVYRVQSGDIHCIVCAEDDYICDNVAKAQKECPVLQKLMTVRADREGFIRLDKGMEQESDRFERVQNSYKDPFLMYFTSGTTGFPKAVLHAYSYPLAHIITAKYWQNVEDGGLHLTVADTGWGKASWGKIYGQWLCGSAVMVYDFEKFNADDLMNVIRKYSVTSFCAPPTIYRFLVKSGLEKYDFSSIKYAATAGEALNPDIMKKFNDVTGLEIKEGYGQTETTLLVANLYENAAKVGSIGKPSPLYKLAIVNENGDRVPAGEVGEIVVIPTDDDKFGLCLCYDKDDQANLRAWRNGVYHTGDTAYCDENGYYWYIGRIDDIIKSSGYRIGPFEVESVLIKHPAVFECAITGVPDRVRGNVVKATVVLQKGYQPSDELIKELQSFVKKETAPYKYPRIIEFVDEIPKTISGKIQHNMIRSKDKEKISASAKQ